MELKKGITWCGILDRDLRVFDIIMETEFGTTYNSYVVKGSEKTALIETAKEKFFDEYLQKVQAVTDVQKIDYLVVDHTEPDHAGSAAKLLELKRLREEGFLEVSGRNVRFLSEHPFEKADLCAASLV